MMRLTILVFLLGWVFMQPATAQDQPDVPLVINIDGQIFRWSAGDAQPIFTGCDLQGERVRLGDYSLTLSPDGIWAAFMVLPEDRLFTAPDSTGNLWVCNVRTGEAYALTRYDPGYPDRASEGAFSPDGSRIIWTETENMGQEETPARLFVHVFATGETNVLVETLPLTEYCGIGTGAPRVIWGEPGIAVGYFRFDPADPCNGDEEIGFAHYAEDGTLLNSFPVASANFSDFEWLDGEEPVIAYFGRKEGSREQQLASINMTTGEVGVEEAALEAYVPGGESAAGTYLLTKPAFNTLPPQMKLPAGVVLEAAVDVALSPDGQHMAILRGRMLYFAGNDRLEPAAWNLDSFNINDIIFDAPDYTGGQLEIAWATPAYRLVALPETVCPSLEPLDIQGSGFVLDGTANNQVYAAPDINAAILGSLDPETAFMLLDEYDFSAFYEADESGYVCSTGRRWREILFEEQIGWIVEAQGATYFLTAGRG